MLSWSYAHNCRAVAALRACFGAAPADRRRHLVAATVADDRCLLLFNDPAAPSAPEPLPSSDQGLRWVRWEHLPALDLAVEYPGPVLLLPGAAALRPELEQLGSRRFELAAALGLDAADPVLADTRRALVLSLERRLRTPGSHEAGLTSAALETAIRRLRFANLLKDQPVSGLLAVLPGPELAYCVEEATLVFASLPDLNRPEGLFLCATVERPEDLADAVAGCPVAPFVLGPLGALCRNALGIVDLSGLLDEALRLQDWAGSAPPTAAWLDEHGQSALAQGLHDLCDPFAAVARELREGPATWSAGRTGTLNGLEAAYATVGNRAARHWQARGHERVLAVAHTRLTQHLDAQCQTPGPAQAFNRALRCWYQATPDDTAQTEPLRETRDLLARFAFELGGRQGFVAGPLLSTRAEHFDFAANVLQELADAGALSQPVLTELRARAGASRAEAGAPWLPEPRPGGPADAALRGLLERALVIAELHEEALRLDSAGGDPDRRARELRDVARRIRELPALFGAPPHERTTLRRACAGAATAVDQLAGRLSGIPDVAVTLGTPRIEMPTDERAAAPIFYVTVANVGRRTALDVAVRPLPSPQHQVLGGLQVVRRIASLAPQRAETIEFQLRPRTTGRVVLDFLVRYGDPDGHPHEKRVGLFLDVAAPARARAATEPFDYPEHPVLDAERLHGQREALHNVLRRLAHPGSSIQNLVLRGPRGGGKTSFLKVLAALIRDPSVRPLFDVSPEWAPALDRFVPVLASAADVAGEPRLVQTFFSRLLAQLGTGLGLATESAVGEAAARLQRCSDDPTHATFAAAVQDLFALAANGGRPLFLVDEFEVFNETAAPGFLSRFRTLLNGNPWMSWIVGSARPIPLDVPESPLRNILEEVRLRPLDYVDVRALIVEPVGEGTFDEPAVQEVFNACGGHPRITKMLCRRLAQRHDPGLHDRVRRDQVVAAELDLLRSWAERPAKSDLFPFWNDLGNLDRALLIAIGRAGRPLSAEEASGSLRADARLPDKVRVAAEPAAVTPALAELEAGWLLQAVDGRFDFQVPLFKAWLEVAILPRPAESWFGTEAPS